MDVRVVDDSGTVLALGSMLARRGGTISRVLVNVSREAHKDLEMEAIAAFKRD